MKLPDNLATLIEQAANNYGDRTAYIWRPGFRAQIYTFADIHRMAMRTAVLLQSQGVRQGQHVVLWAVNSPFWVAAFYGCQLAGVVPVPLMARNTREFILRIADVTDARAILKSVVLKLPDAPVPVLDIETELVREDLDTGFERAPVSPADVAQILFTSGTTGNPKGVPLKHSNMLSNVADIISLDILRPDDHIMSFLPLAHVFEQIVSLITAPASGVPVTQAASLSGIHIRMNMEEDRPSIMLAVPEFLKLAVQQIELKAEQQGKTARLERLYKLGPKLPMGARRFLAREILTRFGGRLRLVVAGGSALDPQVGDKWEAFGVIVLQGYGATETSPVVAVNRPHNRKTSSVGPPMPSVQVRIAEDGEVLARGPNVVDGYFNRPEETAERFKDGWYHTDDLGELDSDGHLHIKGRKKFLIVTPAGENIYPEDLESELNKEPEIRDSAVLGLERHHRWEVHAVLLPASGQTITDPLDIVNRVNERLEPHQRMNAASVWDGEDFPRTVTRKVRKNDVRDWLLAQEAGAEARPFVPAGAVERAIAAAAGVPAERLRPEDRLEADLKLDSLGRVTLVSILEEELGVVLDEGRIPPEATVADIGEMVSQRSHTEEIYQFNPKPLSRRAIWLRDLAQRLIIMPLISLIAPMRIEGRENLRGLEGPLLIVPNHISAADGIVVKALPARLRKKAAIAAGADVVYEKEDLKRFAGALEMLVNIYPFARETQVKSSLVYTGRLMDRGFSVVLFPEGHISPDGRLQEIKTGAGLLAVELGAPVLPVAITGTDKIVPADVRGFVRPKRAPVTIRFGKLLQLESDTPYEEAAAQIQRAIADVLPPEQQPLQE